MEKTTKADELGPAGEPRLARGWLGLLVNPLLRRGYQTPALVLVGLLGVGAGWAAAYGLLAFAASGIAPMPIAFLSGLSGALVGMVTLVAGLAIFVSAPVWITASALEGRPNSTAVK
ncbi:hypothetical protein [Streptomyces sp. NBC_01304]|uniref:hypothetical protein n=1 Tax=Streptomyces sp. NBC_01304 TaxID=2903818 RepID=UPI002E0D48DF|nr:hypothetical protein OG430_47675 [Streptomyces sp. NBC_01304]